MKNLSGDVINVEFSWLSLTEFTEISGLTIDEIRELVGMGILSPGGNSDQDWTFDHSLMERSRRLRRLREDLDLQLGLDGLAMAYWLLGRIEELEQQLCEELACRERTDS
ncbi:MAG: chaperone modulator CbpM [Methylotetracoccus sp.]